MSKKRLVICEEALKTFDGHWYEYNKAVVMMNRDGEAETTVLGHQEMSSEIAEELGGIPYFKFTNWDGIYNYPSMWRRYFGILLHNFRVYRALATYFRRQSDPIDCVFAPTIVIHHLIAWWFLVWRFGGRKVKRIVLLIRNSSATYHSDGEIRYARSAKIFGFFLKKFSRFTDSGLLEFATDSHRLADEYKELAGIEMTVLPHPCCIFEEKSPPVQAAQNDEMFRLVSPGPARWEKGTHLLLGALAKLQNPEIRCRIQWPAPVFSPDGVELKPENKFADFLKEPLSSEEYSELLAGADCVLLPYLRELYFARISGVAVEAMLMGIPIIFTDDTWNSDMVSKFGAGLGFASGDTAALAQRIEEMSQSQAKWKAEALKKVASAQRHFSHTNFQNGLWGVKDQTTP